jgi:serine/threonine protein kinase
MEVCHKIGSGTYGTVYKCKSSIVSDSDFAVKMIPFDYQERFFEENMVSAIRELWATSSKYCGIKRLGTVLLSKGSLKKYKIEVSEKSAEAPYDKIMGIGISLPIGDITLNSLLAKMRANGSLLPRRITADIVSQIITKLYNLHVNLNCMHRDLKPGNIILSLQDEKLTVDIIDYGMISFRKKSRDPIVTTAPYRAPEIFLRGYYSHKVDIWSLGAIIFELVTGKAFCVWKNDVSEDSHVLQQIWNRLGRPRFGEISSFDTMEGMRVLSNLSTLPCVSLHETLFSMHDKLRDPNLDILDEIVISCLQLDPDKRPSSKFLYDIDLSRAYDSLYDKLQENSFLTTLSYFITRQSKPDFNAIQLSSTNIQQNDIRFYGVRQESDSIYIEKENNETPQISLDFQFQEISLYYGALRDERNARYAICESILKLMMLHSFPDAFVWNCLLLTDLFISQILIENNCQNKVFMQEDADVFACAVSFICAAPFEERQFVLRDDFLKVFEKSKCKVCWNSMVKCGSFRSHCVLSNECINPVTAMVSVVDLLKRSKFTLLSFAEYQGLDPIQVNTYSPEKCKEMSERFCSSKGEKSWITSLLK